MQNAEGGYEVVGHAESIADVFLTVLGWGFNSSRSSSEVLF